MKSIPVAMTWEILRRDRWTLAAAAIVGLALPTVILAALAQDGVVDPNDRSLLLMHVVMVQLNGVIFGSAVVSVAHNMKRLYTHPASTSTLVAWRLAPAMILMAAETVVWTLVINAIFHLNWPLWGPALVEGVAIAAVIAAFWIAGGSNWVILALTIVAAAIGIWFKSRYGSAFGEPLHAWDRVTPGEVFMLVGMAGVASVAAYLGLRRNRHGAPPFSLGIVAWINRALDRLPSRKVAFSSPLGAQSWYVRRLGWLMPGGVVACASVGFIIWVFTSRDASDLFKGAVVGSRLMLLIAGFGGAVFGNLGNEKDLAMGQFLATRPMYSLDMCRVNLRLAVASLLFAWLIWGAVALLACGIALAMGDALPPLVQGMFDWRELPATFLGSWVIVGGFSSVLLTGRSKLITILIATSTATFTAVMILAKLTLSPQAHATFLSGLMISAGIAFVAGTLLAFVAAWRCGLISGPATWASLAAVTAFIAGAALLFPGRGDVPLAMYSLVIGLLTLTVAPFAAAPLAVVWNRHR